MALRKAFWGLIWIAAVPLLALTPISGSQGGGQAPDLNSLSDNDLKTVTVRFERTRCYGTCPAYALTIHGDGRIEYVGTKYVQVADTREGQIPSDVVRALLSEFAKAKFLAVPEDYSREKCNCRRCTDMPSAITELTVGPVSHRVNHYYGCACAPKALFDLESAIDKVVKAEQWTGDVSKQGPFGTTCFGS